jgi:hypothetical protein
MPFFEANGAGCLPEDTRRSADLNPTSNGQLDSKAIDHFLFQFSSPLTLCEIGESRMVTDRGIEAALSISPLNMSPIVIEMTSTSFQ